MTNQKKQKQQEMAVTLANSMAQQLAMTQILFQDPGERTTLNVSAAMIGVTATCITMMKHEHMGLKYVPTSDHVQFACMFIANSSSFDSAGALMVEFDIGNVIKTMDQFQELTGRSFDSQLNDTLLELVKEQLDRAQSAATGDFSKFLPQ